MAKFLTQTQTISLAQLQACGNASGRDFPMPAQLPMDCLIVGTEIIISQAVAGPGLTGAIATFILLPAPPAVADMTTPATYQNGGQQIIVNINIQGCTMALLTSGTLTANIYYDRFTQTRFPISPV